MPGHPAQGRLHSLLKSSWAVNCNRTVVTMITNDCHCVQQLKYVCSKFDWKLFQRTSVQLVMPNCFACLIMHYNSNKVCHLVWQDPPPLHLPCDLFGRYTLKLSTLTVTWPRGLQSKTATKHSGRWWCTTILWVWLFAKASKVQEIRNSYY